MATFRLRTVGALLVGALLLTVGCVSPLLFAGLGDEDL